MDIKKILPGVKKNILLKRYTTFKIGGPIRYFFSAKNKDDLIKALMTAKKLKIPFFILGGGSNLLAKDQGFKGLVIKCQISDLKYENQNIYAGAGVELSKLIRLSLKKALTGIEWAIGIPGTVGGAVFGNAGAFGRSMKDIIKRVEIFDLKKEKIIFLDNKRCHFDYRESIFKNNKNLIILSCYIKLRKGNIKSVKKKIRDYLDYKKVTQPLNYYSAGSIFKNFVFQQNSFSSVVLEDLKKFQKKGIIPAAWLIEKCGLKGKTVGGAEISLIHANFIVNSGNAKEKDVKKLISLVKNRVKKKFGIVLKEEIQYL